MSDSARAPALYRELPKPTRPKNIPDSEASSIASKIAQSCPVLFSTKSSQDRTVAERHFFVVPTITFRPLFAFAILLHDRRRLVHLAVTANPTEGWTTRQLLEAFPLDSAPRYLLRDRDGCYGEEFHEARGCLDIREVLTAPQWSWQNPYLG